MNPYPVTSFPDNKILDWFKFKAFADDIIKFDKMMIFVFDMIKNIGGEIAGDQHFLHFAQNFQRLLFQGR